MSEVFVIPPGKKTGCNYRTSKVGGICSLWGEKMEVLTDAELKQAIEDRKAAGIRGRDSVKEILDQDGVGSCATEMTAQGIRTQKVRQNFITVQLNPWFLYYHASGGVDRGSGIDEDIALGRDIGCPSMEVWPRSKGWKTKPSAEAYADALNHRIWEVFDVTSQREAMTALVKDYPVGFGHDSHAELMVDILSLTEADVANSWSTEWGDKGFHSFPFARINFAYGCFAFRAAE
jgi:hypothetical protein